MIMKTREDLEVLIVDDIPGMRTNTILNLKELKLCKFTEANSVEEAISIIKTKPIDMIVSEWALAPDEGIDLLKFVRISPIYEKIPFIFTSSYREQRHLNEALNYKVNAFIIKPYEDSVLMSHVDKLINKIFKV